MKDKRSLRRNLPAVEGDADARTKRVKAAKALKNSLKTTTNLSRKISQSDGQKVVAEVLSKADQ